MTCQSRSCPFCCIIQSYRPFASLQLPSVVSILSYLDAGLRNCRLDLHIFFFFFSLFFSPPTAHFSDPGAHKPPPWCSTSFALLVSPSTLLGSVTGRRAEMDRCRCANAGTADFSHLASILILLHKMVQLKVRLSHCCRSFRASRSTSLTRRLIELFGHLLQVARPVSARLPH